MRSVGRQAAQSSAQQAQAQSGAELAMLRAALKERDSKIEQLQAALREAQLGAEQVRERTFSIVVCVCVTDVSQGLTRDDHGGPGILIVGAAATPQDRKRIQATIEERVAALQDRVREVDASAAKRHAAARRRASCPNSRKRLLLRRIKRPSPNASAIPLSHQPAAAEAASTPTV